MIQSDALFADVPDQIPGGIRRGKKPSSQHAMSGRDEFLAIGVANTGSRVLPGKRVFGPLRLPDVKPPCSNLAPALSGPFSFDEYLTLQVSCPQPTGGGSGLLVRLSTAAPACRLRHCSAHMINGLGAPWIAKVGGLLLTSDAAARIARERHQTTTSAELVDCRRRMRVLA